MNLYTRILFSFMEIRGGHVHSNPNLSHRFSFVLLSLLPMSIVDKNTAHLAVLVSQEECQIELLTSKYCVRNYLQ